MSYYYFDNKASAEKDAKTHRFYGKRCHIVKLNSFSFELRVW